MRRLGDVLTDQRRRLFVGRQTELAYLHRWLADPLAPTMVIAIAGMGGIGKSALLNEMLRIAGEQGAKTLWMDGRTCTRSPAGFLEYLRSLLPCRRGASDPRDALADLMAEGGRVVLGVDNYDDIALLEGWLREDFAGQLPALGILLTIASRPGPSVVWLSDPAWRERLVPLTLSPLTRAESREHLTRLGLGDSPAAERLIREAAGHPLALCLGAEVIQGHESASPALDAALPQKISLHLLHEVARPDLHPLLEALAVVPAADEELMAGVLGEAPAPDQYRALTQLSFVQISDRGLALHDVARDHLLDDLRLRAPERFLTMRRRALSVLRARLRTAAGPYQRQRLAADLMVLCRHALPIQAWFADMTAIGNRLTLSPVRREDVPALREMMIRWVRFGYPSTALEDDPLRDELCLLDALCERFPDYVRVVRSPRGEPLSFGATVLLHRESAAILERYRTGAVYLRQCSAAERQTLDCSPAEADTYYYAMSSAAVDHPECSVGELYGFMLRDFLALTGDGVRIMVVQAHPDMAALSASLGLVCRPDCEDTWPGVPWPWRVWELDLRRRDFGEWVSAFLAGPEGEPPPVGAVAGPAGTGSAGQQLVESQAVVQELRCALKVIDYPSQLQRCALACRLGCSGQDLRALLWETLNRDDPPPPLTAADQQVLRAMLLRRDCSRDAVATSLHVSRSTYFRRLRAAIGAMAEALRNRV